MNLTDQNHWNTSFSATKLELDCKIPDHPLITGLAQRYIIDAQQGISNKTVIEIGCCPGRFLAYFAQRGYTVSGLDFIEAVNYLAPQFHEHGLKTGNFYQHDFLQFKTEEKFDVVSSYGFIEHFVNWKEVILIHAELVKPDGFLYITTPNFRGFFQFLYHYLTDKPNLDKHVVGSMRPRKWKALLEKNGFEVLYTGYFGDFFWDEHPKKIRVQFWTQRLIRIASNFSNKLFGISRATGSHCGIIARKKA